MNTMKTICGTASLMIVAVALNYFKAIDADTFKAIMGVLGPIIIATLGIKMDGVVTEVKEIKSKMLEQK